MPATLVLVAVAGCGGGEPWGAVKGQVFLEGMPAPDVIVLFSCPERGVEMATVTDRTGGFTLTTARFAGLPVGAYQVAIKPALYSTPKDGMTFDTLPNKKDRPTRDLPASYGDPRTSGLTATVEKGSNYFPFHLQATPGQPRQR